MRNVKGQMKNDSGEKRGGAQQGIMEIARESINLNKRGCNGQLRTGGTGEQVRGKEQLAIRCRTHSEQ